MRMVGQHFGCGYWTRKEGKGLGSTKERFKKSGLRTCGGRGRHCFVARIWKLLLLPNMRRILAIVIVGSSMLGADAQAQSAVRAHQYTTQEHTQTSDGTPVGTGEYRFV